MNGRSLWAVAAGVLVIVIGSTVVDLILHATHFFPPTDQPITDMQATVATGYRFVISVGGAWLTARLAPNQPLKHAVVLGIVGTVLGLLGVILTWNAGLGPRWYAIALTVLAVPQCWLGGMVFVSKHPQGGA